MASARKTRRVAKSQDHIELGTLLRAARTAAGISTRALGYSSGHISNVENGFVTPSRALLDEYVHAGADPAAVHGLLDHIQRQPRPRSTSEPRTTKAPQHVDDNTDPDALRRHYTVEKYDVEFIYTNTGGLTRVTSTVALRATTPGVRFYYTGHSPDGTRRQQDLGIHAVTGATLAHATIGERGAAQIFFELDRPLHPDDPEPYAFTYQVDLSGTGLADEEIHYYTRPGVKQHRLTCQFTAPALPTRVWRLAAPDGFTADKVGPQNAIPINGKGRYDILFDRIIPGWVYGMAWRWPDLVTATHR